MTCGERRCVSSTYADDSQAPGPSVCLCETMKREVVLLSPNVKKKKWKSCPVKAISQKCFCCLHLFINYLFLYILIVYVLYHDYLLVFIDYFLFKCKVCCIRVIFLYQKVFHTCMCSIYAPLYSIIPLELIINRHYCYALYCREAKFQLYVAKT